MERSGLLYGFVFDGKGGARKMALADVQSWKPEDGILWLHFDYSTEDARNWITRESGIDEVAADALLTGETRPRTIIIDDAALMALRGVNLNPGFDPEDMVSVRLWVDKHKIISTQKRSLLSIRDIAESLGKNHGPRTSGEFVVELTGWLIVRMQDTIEGIEDKQAEIEEEALSGGRPDLRATLLDIRREAITLRRHLSPQREALTRLSSENLTWMRPQDRLQIREVTDSLIRYLEDLDSARDRATVTQEELANHMTEQINSRMYVLSIVAAIFMPLGFLTGLLGVNVGGIPGAGNKWAFLIFMAILACVVALQFLFFKKKKWI